MGSLACQEAVIVRVCAPYRVRSILRGVIAAWVLGFFLAHPMTAHAMSGEAQTLYERARASLETGDHAGALVDFKRAIPLFRTEDADVWQIQVAIALTYEMMGDLPSAIEYYDRYLSSAAPHLEYAGQKWRTRHQLIEQTRSDLHVRAGRQYGMLQLASDPPGAQILVDGRPVGADDDLVTPAMLYLSGGRHRLAVVRSDTGTQAVHLLDVQAGERKAWIARFPDTGKVVKGAGVGPPLADPSLRLVQQRWETARTLLMGDGFQGASGFLSAVRSAQIDGGIPSLPGPARVVAGAAWRAMSTGDGASGLALARTAMELAPDLPDGHFAAAWAGVFVAGSPWSVVVTDLAAGFRALWKHVPSRVIAQEELLSTLQACLLLLLLMFSLGIALRYTRHVAMDLRVRLPRGLHLTQVVLFVTIVLIAPIVMGLGLIPSVLAWMLVFHAYMGRTERILAALLVLGVAALPWTQAMITQLRSVPAGWTGAASICAVSPCGEEELAQLTEVATSGEHPGALLALAHYHHWSGRSDQAALNRAELHVARGAQMAAVVPGAAVLHANHQFATAGELCAMDPGAARERLESAKLWYEKALERDPEHLEALYNASVLARSQGSSEEAHALYARALSLDDGRLMEFEREVVPERPLGSCPSGFNPARRLLTPRFDAVRLLDGISWMNLDSGVQSGLPAGPLLLGILSIDATPVIAGVWFALAVLLLGMWRIHAMCWSCERCGRVTSAKEHPELEGVEICEVCLLERLRGTHNDPRHAWLRNRRIRVARQRRRTWTRLVSCALPGAGHLLRGRALRGAFWFVAFLGLVILALTPPALMEGGLHMSIIPETGRVILCGGFLGVVYMFAQWGAWRIPERG